MYQPVSTTFIYLIKLNSLYSPHDARTHYERQHKEEKRKIDITKAEAIPLRHCINPIVLATLETHYEHPHKEETAINEYPHKRETPIIRIFAQREDRNKQISTKRRRIIHNA